MASSPRRGRIAATLVPLLAGWFAFAPLSLGGQLGYVTTHGISMQPLLHTGDLAVFHPASSYRVGDVVAYRSETLHTVVLHRIVARDAAGRFITKGDNNDWLDPDHPTPDAVLGRQVLHVPHGSAYLSGATRPAVLGPAFAALALLAGGGARRRRRNARRGRAAGQDGAVTAAVPPAREETSMNAPDDQRLPGSPPSLHVAPATWPPARTDGSAKGPGVRPWVVGGLLCAAVAGVLFQVPTTHLVPHSDVRSGKVNWTYSASVPAGAAYPHGRVGAPQPVFLRLADRLTVSAATQPAAGTPPTLRATVGTADGWQVALPLAPGPARPGAASATLDLRALTARLRAVGAETGAGHGVATVTVTATGPGWKAALPLQDDGIELRADPATLTAVHRETTTSLRRAPVTLPLGRWRLPLAPLPWCLAAVACLALVAAALRRRLPPRARRGTVSAESVRIDAGRTIVDVTDVETLHAIGRREQRPVLRTTGDGVLLVDDGITVYRHRPARRGQARGRHAAG